VVERRNPSLVNGVDGGRGPVVSWTPKRFQNLLEVLQELASDTDLCFDVRQNLDDELEFITWERTDSSRDIRLDIQNDQLESIEYGVGAPGVTRVIVAGQGEGVDRLMIRRTSTSSVEAETLWGRVIERFVDARHIDDETELQQAGDDALAEEGS